MLRILALRCLHRSWMGICQHTMTIGILGIFMSPSASSFGLKLFAQPLLRPRFGVHSVQRSGLRFYMSPNEVNLPVDRLEFSYARASGPGGQNVNKLNTKAEVRFHVPTADWLKPDVRDRLMHYNSNKMNNDGELIVTSQEHRTQAHNREDCLKKLRVMISEASVAPKDRHMYEGISEVGKERRKDDKRKRSQVKEGRRQKNSKDLFD